MMEYVVSAILIGFMVFWTVSGIYLLTPSKEEK